MDKIPSTNWVKCQEIASFWVKTSPPAKELHFRSKKKCMDPEPWVILDLEYCLTYILYNLLLRNTETSQPWSIARSGIWPLPGKFKFT